MKFEKINGNKIKITVSIEDLHQWGVTMDSFAGNSQQANEMFLNLITRAESETGFYVNDSQLLVEALPLKNEGMVFFFTKVDEFRPDSFDKSSKPRPKRISGRYKVKSNAMDCSFCAVYVFDSFDDVCALAQLWNFDVPNTLFCFNQRYYLTVGGAALYSDRSLRILLSEFARPARNPAVCEAFLFERAQLICADEALKVIKEKVID